MKNMKRAIALLLALIVVQLPVLAVSADSFVPVNSAVECAIYLMDQYALGEQEGFVLNKSQATAGELFEQSFLFVRMMLAEYYTMECVEYSSPGYLSFRITLDGREPQRALAVEKAAQVVAEIIDPAMTQREKLLTLHDYVLANCEYDQKAARNKDYAEASVFTAYGMLIDGSAVCDGYSAAFALLCKAAGIPCVQVFNPEMEGEGHSWNAVLLGGRVLYIDTTFDDTAGVPWDDTYFLKTADELRTLGHIWDEGMAQTLLEVLWSREFVAAANLNALGLFRGSDKGYELERTPYRSESGVMLLRLMGLEQEAQALAGQLACPFEDVSAFYVPFVAFLNDRGLTRGTSETTFSPNQYVDAQQYMTFVLRALGYDDGAGDFVWNEAVQASVTLGVLSQDEADALLQGTFDRGAMAYVSYRALFAQLKTGGRLADHLVEVGYIDGRLLAEIENNP